MKLILTHEVNGLGSPGDVVDVKPGYGRNYLLPQGLATAWTKGGEKQVTQIKRARGKRAVRDREHALDRVFARSTCSTVAGSTRWRKVNQVRGRRLLEDGPWA